MQGSLWGTAMMWIHNIYIYIYIFMFDSTFKTIKLKQVKRLKMNKKTHTIVYAPIFFFRFSGDLKKWGLP